MNALQTIQDKINAFADVFSGDEDGNAEGIQVAANKLGQVLHNASNADWSKDELTEYVLSENDPLDNVDGISDLAREEVREIQHAIINTFAND